jgi:hypothetical protein
MGSPALGIIMILQRSIRVRGGMGLSLIPALSAATSSGDNSLLRPRVRRI